MNQRVKFTPLLVIVCMMITMLLPMGTTANAAGTTHTVPSGENLRALLEEDSVKDGDTIVLQGKGFVNDTNNDAAPWIINKAVTIKGGNLHLRAGGIILGADVTFEDVTLEFANPVRNVIMANGHTLTLNNVSRESSTQQVHLLAGGLTGHNTTTTIGTHGKISIQGSTSLGNMYAGSLSADGQNNNSDLPATLIIDSSATGSMGNVYASGALEIHVSNNWFEFKETYPPLANPDNYKVTGKVNIELYNNVVSLVDGRTGGAINAAVTYTGGTHTNTTLKMEYIADLSLVSGKLTPYWGSNFSKGVSLSIPAGTELGLNKFSEDLSIVNFVGGGTLTLGQNQIMTISGNVSGTTNIGIGNMFDGQPTAPTKDHPYIVAINSTENSFELSPPNNQQSEKLRRDINGDWFVSSASGGTNPSLQIPVPTANNDLRWTGQEQTGVREGIGYTLNGHREISVGRYTATATLDSGYQWSDGTTVEKSITWNINKAKILSIILSLSAIGPSTATSSDGAIRGTTINYEYSTDRNFVNKWDAGNLLTTDLAPGTYYVRIKETATHEASHYAVISVPAYNEPTVTSIVVNSTEHKTFYNVGDALDVTGLTIEVIMSDNSKKTVDVPKDAVIGFDSSNTSVVLQTLFIFYEGEITSYQISFPRPVFPPTATKHTVTVDNSYAAVSGAGSYTVSDAVYISAGTRSGYTFDGWTSSGVTLASPKSADTSFIMPTSDVNVTANWRANSANGPGGGSPPPVVTPPVVSPPAVMPPTVTSSGVPPTSNDDASVPPKEEGTTNTPDPTTAGKSNEPNKTASSKLTDLIKDSWYLDAVEFVIEKGIMTGTSDTSFSPDLTTSRGMLAVILYRLEGSPTVSGNMPFKDVQSNKYYADAIKWAAQTGIVNGYSDGTFNPDAPITREELVSMLWKYKGAPIGTEQLLNFKDADDVKEWAQEAFKWATQNKIISGDNNGNVLPKGHATRVQVAQIIMNLLKNNN